MLATVELIREDALPYRLGAVLPGWLREVPLYQHLPKLPTEPGGTLALADLGHLPLITKQDIRNNFPHNFLRAGTDLEALVEADVIELEHTSGTSEERTPLLLGRGWWLQQEERALRLNPLVRAVLDEHPAARRVTISSPVCSGDICYTGIPSRADRTLGNALFLSLSRYPFLWAETELARMAAEAVEWQPQFLDLDPVYGVVFALYCERRGIRLPSLRFILCSYEFVSIVHRRILERVFGVPVFNLYGSTETGHLLMETAPGQMKPSFETAALELHNPDSQGIGDLVVTTLTNDFMPLIRYRIGDLVERHERPYGTTYVVHGRAADAFLTADRRRVSVWQIDQCFQDVPGVAHYQLCQRTGGAWLLRFVPDASAPTKAQFEELQSRVAQLIGGSSGLTLQQTDLLVPESSGKFRLGYPSARSEP